MPRPHITWQPLFLTEPESFARLLEEPSLDRRLRSWRGYEDMLLGEALRAGLHDDRAARTSLEELYAFGLANGLPLWSRREAVRALRAYAGRYPLPGSTWGPFLRLDPDWQVALTAASAWLESEDTQAASALLKALEEERLANRGGVFGALLRHGVIAPLRRLREGLEARELEDVAACCSRDMSSEVNAFLTDWLETLAAAENGALRDILGRCLELRAGEADPRRVAEHFLPRSAEVIPIHRRRGRPAGSRYAPATPPMPGKGPQQ
ncbi:Hypothetical protein HVPorG_00571 [Roseomonas mucosa]|uniref:hypothetical protein n=1 Tax=Roseomonas mucosa TaxID=207340 RepID=UPI0022049606|nr:hypothetical protein [Roseomonas mucosa]QDJ08250.1 Hypothetical protein HVPorG_00571 [Roseomonas mucosa]